MREVARTGKAGDATEGDALKRAPPSAAAHFPFAEEPRVRRTVSAVLRISSEGMIQMNLNRESEMFASPGGDTIHRQFRSRADEFEVSGILS